MLRYLFLVTSTICALIQMTSLTAAKDCPVAGGEAKLSVVASAQTCQEAARLFKSCAIGASLDARLAHSVAEVCEKSFLPQLSDKEREAYRAAIEACNAAHAGERGTIYRAVAAHCRVDAMVAFAKGH